MYIQCTTSFIKVWSLFLCSSIVSMRVFGGWVPVSLTTHPQCSQGEQIVLLDCGISLTLPSAAVSSNQSSTPRQSCSTTSVWIKPYSMPLCFSLSLSLSHLLSFHPPPLSCSWSVTLCLLMRVLLNQNSLVDFLPSNSPLQVKDHWGCWCIQGDMDSDPSVSQFLCLSCPLIIIHLGPQRHRNVHRLRSQPLPRGLCDWSGHCATQTPVYR